MNGPFAILEQVLSGSEPEVLLFTHAFEGDRLFVFLTVDGHDATLFTSPLQKGTEGATWQWVAGDFEFEPSPEVRSLVEGRLNPSLESASIESRTRMESGKCQVLPHQARWDSPFLFQGQESTRYGFEVAGSKVELEVGGKGLLDFDYLHWSGRIHGGSLTDAQRGVVFRFFFLTLSRYLLGQGPPRVSSVTEAGDATGASHPSLNVYLNDGLPSLESVTQLLAGDPSYVLLNLELPGQCRQGCVFCEKRKEGSGPNLQPPENTRKLLDELVGNLRRRLPETTRLDLSLGGKDCLEAPTLHYALERFRRLPNLGRVNLVTPGTRLEEGEFVEGLKGAGVDGVTVTLLGDTAQCHDAIAGKTGAHNSLMAGLANLDRVQLPWEINVVIVKDNLSALAGMLQWAKDRDVKPKLLAYVADPTVSKEDFQRLHPRWTQFATVLEENRSLVQSHVASIHYVPHCTVPEWAQEKLGHSRRSHSPTGETTPPGECSDCPRFGTICPSLGALYREVFGDEEVTRFQA